MEVKESVEGGAPIGNPMWIAAEPGLQPEEKTNQKGDRRSNRGKDLGGIRTTAIRNVEAGEFVMEVWVEEGRGKVDALEDQDREGG